jgi:galactose mutarotase-like enzyme
MGAELVELHAGDLVAAYAPRLGMVCASLRHCGDELLGQRRGLEAYARSGSTFGIPLLHPWANRLGAWDLEVLGRRVRLEGSRLVLERTERRLHAAFDFDTAELLEAFPFPHRLELDVHLRPESLETTTVLTATGDTPVPAAFGFHPYLQIPGVPRSEWEIALPVRRRLVLDERGIPTGRTEDVEPYAGPLGDRTFDDGFDRLDDGRPFSVAGGGRRIEVAFGGGFPVAQVFAPPGQDLICFEPMAAATNALADGSAPAVAPGERAEARFDLRVVTTG